MTELRYDITRTWQVKQFEPLTIHLGITDDLREGERPMQGYDRLRSQLDAMIRKIGDEVEDDSD